MNNYKLLIQYKGRNYSGWQIQPNAQSVQGVLTDAINKITGERINLIGSGRTDAGVHAFGQVANFQIGRVLDEYRFKYSLNSILPPDIAVITMDPASEEFHARFNAKSRSYIYLIVGQKSPFYDEFAYFAPGLNDQFILRANKLSKKIIGEFDFTSFCKVNSDIKSKICRISNLHWKKSKSLIYFYIEANRFLHGMVRAITGTVLEGIKENAEHNYLLNILEKRKREAAGQAAPAKGLFLYKVKY